MRARQTNTSPRMTSSSHVFSRSTVIWMLSGLLVLAAAWIVPVNLKSVTPALLKAAAADTPSPARFGRQLLDRERPGPAALALAAARSLGDPQADALATSLDKAAHRQPEIVTWGG